MNRVINATKLDFYASKSMLRMTSLLVIIGVVIGLAAHGPEYMMMFIMVFAVTSSGSVFSVHEKCHSDKLYGILPLKKSEMILGRYLYALIIGAAYAATGGILGFAMSMVMSGRLNALPYWATLAIAFAYFCFAVGVAYPIFFKFSFTKAYVFTMLPMYVIAVLFLFVTRRTDFTSGIGSAIKFFTAHVYLLPTFGLLAGLVLLVVSALIANLVYTRKEI